MTTLEIARAAGCSTQYVHVLRRIGLIAPTSVSRADRRGSNGGAQWEYAWNEDVIPIIRRHKATARSRMGGTGAKDSPLNSVRREWCAEEQRLCATRDLGECGYCRERTRIELGVRASGTTSYALAGGGR